MCLCGDSSTEQKEWQVGKGGSTARPRPGRGHVLQGQRAGREAAHLRGEVGESSS